MASPQAIAMEIANSLPGCEAQRFALEGNTVLSGRVMGWGPSLHRTGLSWAVTPHKMTPEAIEDALTPYLDIQRGRIAAAKQLGLDDKTQPEGVDHMVVDSVLLDLVPTWREDAKRAVSRFFTFSISGRDTHLDRFGIAVSDGCPEKPQPRYTARTYIDDIIYDGTVLMIMGQRPPDSIVMSMTGMSIGNVVASSSRNAQSALLIERIAERKIVSAEVDSDFLTLRFEGSWVSMG